MLAYEELGEHAQWLFLTLPALVSPSGRQLSGVARSAGAKVAVTLSSAADVLACGESADETLATVDLVLGNAEEFSALRRSGSWASVAVETLGEEGAMVHEPGSPSFHVPLPSGLAPPLVDTTGAGDAFAAGVIAGLSTPRPGGRSLASAVELGHRAASVIVAQVGASLSLRSRDLLRLLGSHHGVTAG